MAPICSSVAAFFNLLVSLLCWVRRRAPHGGISNPKKMPRYSRATMSDGGRAERPLRHQKSHLASVGEQPLLACRSCEPPSLSDRPWSRYGHTGMVQG